MVVAVSVLSLWAAIFPNIWIATIAVTGFSAGVINGPTTFSQSVSIRGLVMACALLPMLITVIAAVMVAWSMSGFASPAVSEPRSPKEYNPWETVSLQVYGISAGKWSKGFNNILGCY